jgi:GTPase SAR1 family protein
MYQMLHHSIGQENGISKLPRMAELFEKATPGIVIALCGNKCDLEERQIAIEVNLLI